MSQLVLIEMYESGGKTYGRVSDPLEFMKSQNFAHGHIERIVRALLTQNSPAAQVEGFDYALTDGLSMSIAAGQVIIPDGLSYDTLPEDEPTVVTMPAAHVSQPRIDLVYARVETVDTELEYRPHIELVEYGDPLPPEENFNVPTERHVRATVLVKQGVAAAVPVAPVTGPNEVPLYQVTVDAGATDLVVGNVTDVRNQARSLYEALTLIDAINASLAPASLNETIDDRVSDLLADSTYLTKVYGDEPADILTLDVDLPALYTPLDARYALLSTFVEAVQDALTAFFPDASPFDWTYDDAGNRVQLDIATATAALKGLLAPADKALIDTATSAATANALFKRDANADGTLRRLVLNIATGTAPLGITSTTEVPNLNANLLQGQNLAALDARYAYLGPRYAGSGLSAAIALTTLLTGGNEWQINCMVWCTAGGGGNATVLLTWTDPNGNTYTDVQIATTGLGGGGNRGSGTMYIASNTGAVQYRVTYAGPGTYGIRLSSARFN